MKTVFILGAGSSVEFGYPWGKELKDKILTLLNEKNLGYEQLVAAGNAPEDITSFSRRLARADIDTIDQFIEKLDSKDAIRSVGRQAIALAIAFSENPNLFNQPLNKDSQWYRVFRDYLLRNETHISSKYFSFLTFNYDVALEHYLYETITSGSSNDLMGRILADDFLRYTNFVHLHGRIGVFDWMGSQNDIKPRPYAERISNEDLPRIGSNLVLPHQKLNTGELRQLLLNAETVVILGFGFHPSNLERIFFDELVANSNTRILATVYGLESEKIEMLNRHERVEKFNMPCRLFVREYLRRLDTNTLVDWKSGPAIVSVPPAENAGDIWDSDEPVSLM
jgi:hypothetical protein